MMKVIVVSLVLVCLVLFAFTMYLRKNYSAVRLDLGNLIDVDLHGDVKRIDYMRTPSEIRPSISMKVVRNLYNHEDYYLTLEITSSVIVLYSENNKRMIVSAYDSSIRRTYFVVTDLYPCGKNSYKKGDRVILHVKGFL